MSYNWLKEYVDTDLSPEELAEKLTLHSFPVERITKMREELEGMIVGEVVALREHPNADKLRLADVDIGEKQVQIVCGGQNLREGMKVFVAPPGAFVRWHGEGEPVVLKEAKIRGEKSFGMICAPNEVGFEKATCPPEGIWDLSDLAPAAKPGTPVVDALGIDDAILDVEITTNRPDGMGVIGLAREIGTSTKSAFTFDPASLPEGGSGKDLKVTIKEPELCKRFMGVVIDGVRIGPSPAWLQTKLLLAGHRPINNVVDITNFVLHEYGRPMHVFDYDKVEGGEIIVRKAGGEKFVALDEKEYELGDDHLVIADAKKAMSVGGVMGGLESGATEDTKTIVFECAAFDPVSIRRTARDLGLYSDSQLLFEKGLSTESAPDALARAIELTLELAGGQVASPVIDARPNAYESLVFPFRPQKARDLIGADLSDDEMIEILERLGFTVDRSSEPFQVTVPYWRDHDVEHEVDFTEEIARMYGYHNIEGALPLSPPPAYPEDPELGWELQTKDLFAAAGYTEFYGFSFVSEDDLKKYDFDPEAALRLHNPLSADLTHMRPSLMPSVLRDIEQNQGEISSGRIFTMQRVYVPREKSIPEERTHFVFGEYGVSDAEQAFLNTKGALEAWAEAVGLSVSVERLTDDPYWHPTRSAAVLVDGERVGVIGQVADVYQKAFDIDRSAVLCRLDLEAIIPKMSHALSYEPIPEFPSITRDVAVAVDEQTAYSALEEVVRKQSELITSVSLAETYRGEGLEKGQKSLTLSVVLRDPTRTLSSEDADAVTEKIEKALKDEFGANVR